jgi:lipopolysaccharide export system permease protein
LRKLNQYLIKDYLTIFAVAMLLITFAFSIAAVYKAIDIMARGLPVSTVGKFFLYNIPHSLAYSIPIGALFSTLLLFGRLSADSELSAMKSSGLSMWQIISPIILIAIGFVGISLYNNCVVVPSTTYATRQLIRGMGIEDPVKLLEEGRFIRDFPGHMIYVGKKNKNRVRDLVVYQIDEESGDVSRSFRASSGIITTDKERLELKVDLFDVRIENIDLKKAEDDSSRIRYINAKNYPLYFDFSDLSGDRKVKKKRKNMTMSELIYDIRNATEEHSGVNNEDLRDERSRNLVTLNQRICLSVAPLMFVLIAIPLGIKSHRKESSAGMVLSLAIMFVYYIFIILSKTLYDSPELYPWLIPWIPIVFGQLGGFLMLRRAN